MPTHIQLRNWSISSDILLMAILCQDVDYRAKNPNHRCKTWWQEKEGRWFCDHLIQARKRNKRLQTMKRYHRLNSPYILESSKLRKMADFNIKLGKTVDW